METKATINLIPMIGAIVGAILGVAAYLIIVGPGENLILAVIALLSGGALGGFVSLQYANKDVSSKVHGYQDEVKIPLREEHLDILKKKVSTGDLKIHKEVITEEETVTVPVTMEEIVIEAGKVDGMNTGNPKIIRIPLRKEKLNITKTVVALNDVSIFKSSIHETKHIDTTLKKETVQVEDN